MDNLAKTVYILHLDGTPVLRVDFDHNATDNSDDFFGLFSGFSSAINTFVKELGHKEIKSISVGDGVLVYSSREPLLFVVHSTNERYEQLAKLIVKQIEYEFMESYSEVLNSDNAFVLHDFFKPFEATVIHIHDTLKSLHLHHPDLLEFLPSFIPLSALYEVLNMGLDVIEGYPNDTIKIVRQLDKYFTQENDYEIASVALGRYSGHMIARKRFKNEPVIDHDKVLKLLNEISVVKFDSSQEVFDFHLCPICRGKHAGHHICHFFSGFIEGALDNPGIDVEEITCRASGDSSCSFKLHRI